jgi:hypothetical protein
VTVDGRIRCGVRPHFETVSMRSTSRLSSAPSDPPASGQPPTSTNRTTHLSLGLLATTSPLNSLKGITKWIPALHSTPQTFPRTSICRPRAHPIVLGGTHHLTEIGASDHDDQLPSHPYQSASCVQIDRIFPRMLRADVRVMQMPSRGWRVPGSVSPRVAFQQLPATTIPTTGSTRFPAAAHDFRE